VGFAFAEKPTKSKTRSVWRRQGEVNIFPIHRDLRQEQYLQAGDLLGFSCDLSFLVLGFPRL
jgi:hypothetical protein